MAPAGVGAAVFSYPPFSAPGAVPSKRNVVLLATHSGDHYTVDRLASALIHRGADPVRLNTDRFPLGVAVSVESDARRHTISIDCERRRVDGREVAAVWLRQLWEPDLGDAVDPQYRDACLKECRATMRGLFDGLEGARWVNPLPSVRQAGDKCRQLRIAREVGLAIPATIVTNDPDRVRRFYQEVNGRVVTKLLTPLVSSMEKTSGFLHTSEVSPDDLDVLDSLRVCPMVFQERIEKRCELRVAFVAGRLFVGAVDASGTSGEIDWRLATPDECKWRRDELPVSEATRIAELMRRLGLVYGAIDMIRTPAGEHVFLEVNPTGEWGMLERDLDLPISTALADALWPIEDRPP